MAEHGGRRHRLVMVTSPLQGHMTPMLQLATYLHSHHFSITFAHSDFNPPDSSKHPDFTFFPLSDNVTGAHFAAGFDHFLQVLNDNSKPHLHNYLIQLMNGEKQSSEKESIVIFHDYLTSRTLPVLSPANWVCRRLSCVKAVRYSFLFIPSSLNSLKMGRFPPPESLLQETIPELPPFKYKDLPFRNIQSTDQLIKIFTILTPKIVPTAYIWNTLEFLEQSVLTQFRNNYQVPVFTIGPLHKTITTPSTSFFNEDTSCISWLDKHAPKSVIYVSFGSIANLDEKVAIEMAWGLAMSKHPFVWVVRPGLVLGFEWTEFLPEGLLDEIKGRGLIVKWAPQKSILAHNAVGVFWSHCGWNSTLESVSEGVPMLCQPWNVDQMLNGRYVCDVWRVGFEIVAERREIEKAIKRVMVDKEGEEIRERAMEMKKNVEVAVNHGGSSYNSLKDFVSFILSL